jgi:molybdopterin-binding protein
MAGPHRLVSMVTAEAVIELDLKVGDKVVGVVKSTNLMIEIPSPRETRE